MTKRGVGLVQGLSYVALAPAALVVMHDIEEVF